jgi:hypothetical protein
MLPTTIKLQSGARLEIQIDGFMHVLEFAVIWSAAPVADICDTFQESK